MEKGMRTERTQERSAAERFEEDATSVPLVSMHTHTDLSLCGRPDMRFDAVVETAEKLGYHTVVLCDHVHIPGVTDYPRHLARLREYKERRAERAPAVDMVIGGEFEVAAPGRVIAADEFVEVCECAIVSPNHYHLDWIACPRGNAANVAGHELDNIETIIDWPHADVVAHPFAGTGLAHAPSAVYRACDKGRLRDLLQQALEKGIAFEIQPKFWYDPRRADRLDEFFETWLDLGGKVALGSDAHALASLWTWAEHFDEIVARFELTRDDVWWPEKKEG